MYVTQNIEIDMFIQNDEELLSYDEITKYYIM